MAPLPQDYTQSSQGAQEHPVDPISDDDVVISGVSGQFSNCDSFQELAEKIYNKENLVEQERWSIQHPELAKSGGLLRGVNKFDAQFFTVASPLAHATDGLARVLYEHAYQAIFDAGMSPADVSGKNGGVYVAATSFESENACISFNVSNALLGCSRAMFANRISFFMNLNGPSITIDCGSAGTILCLEKGYQAIKAGWCEFAIVGAGKIVQHPQTSVMLNRTILMNKDGKTKCYDAAADGQSISEAVSVIFLQKYKDAKRVYAVLKHVLTGYGVSLDGAFREPNPIPRDAEILSNFFRTFYDQAGVSPAAVEYVEGYGAAVPEIDKVELQAMERVFCKDRKDPLLVGSVTSNVGFTDASSSSCSIFKIISGYQRGELAATINCDRPRQDVAALREGRMRIVTEHAPFNRTYTAVNTLSLYGVNGHALLHGYRKPKDLTKYRSDIPYLVVASGRQESSVQRILDDISSRQLDPEEIALIHNIYKNCNPKHLARGYGIYSTKDEQTVTLSQKVQHYDDAKKPLWFVYSGMGSQWAGMGNDLMNIPVFAESISRCHKVLEPKGLDLINIITTKDESIFDNILHAFVGISSIQVALTDLLASVGLVPSKVIGHSVGELGCAYADGCLTAEQVMLLAYTRGHVSVTSDLDHGAMAAVGMGYKQLSKICPPEIDIACHNNSTSSTISGPYDAIQKFVKQLVTQGVFAKAVDSSNIAYHSRYISKIGPKFLKLSQEVVKEPKLRTDRWVSSSVPFERWSEPNALYSSAEYHTYNLLNTVLFEEALRFVPANAVLVEIAPHCLLQAILKRALPTCQMAPLTRRGHKDGALCLLEGIGNLYMSGYYPDISKLYPTVEFPVSSPTRPLAHLIEWVHTENWNVWRYNSPIHRFCSVFRQIVTVEDDEFKYLKGHHIEGMRVIPFAACLVAVWDTLAMTLGHERRKLSAKFEEVKFHCHSPLRDGVLTDLLATVQRGCGHFEVYDGNVILVEGIITPYFKKTESPANQIFNEDVSRFISKDDVYKLLFERGYEYKDAFQTIVGMDPSMTQGLIEWQGNWVTFLDAVLQMHVLMSKHSWVSQPTALKTLLIDVKKNSTESCWNNGLLEATYDELLSRTRCGGVLAEHISLKHKVPAKRQSLTLQTLKFMPFNQDENIDISSAISNVMQIIAENTNSNKITIFFVNVPKIIDYVGKIKKITQILPEVELDIVTVKKQDIVEYKAMIGKPDAVFLHDLLSDKRMFEALYHVIPSHTFVISVGLDANTVYPSTIYHKISAIGNGKTRVELARFKPNPTSSNMTAITVRNMSDMHQLRSTCEHLPPKHKLLILAPHPVPSGLKEQVKFWRRNTQVDMSMVMFDQKNAMDKELELIPDMAFNVLQEGTWGGEYYVPTKLETASMKGRVSLTCLRPGDFNSLSWEAVDQPMNRGIDVTVHYAGLVGYDASRAQGEGYGTTGGGFGMDFSGVTASGERVMGLMARGSASSKVRVDPRMLWPVPAHWTLEDAATVPFAYCYALYILSRICNPEPGMSILVHGASGALGQALISVSLAYGLDVYAAVSDMHKKRFLKKLFPELKDDHIGNSRDLSFRDMVKRGRVMNGNGANIVVSCAKGALKNVALSSCAGFGYFIDTTQLVTGENYVLGMMSLNVGRTYRTIDFSGKLTEDNDLELRWLQLMLSEGIRKGYVRPLSRVTYTPHETPRAFRLLAASRHRGRVLLSMKEATPVVLPRLSCEPTSSHVVVYEDQEFGLCFADLLVRRGARKLYLHGKNTTYLKYKIRQWENLGVQVDVSSANLTEKVEALSLLSRANSTAAVAGIYVITHPQPKPQADTAILANLDSVSRKVCPNLRYFAVLSEDDRAWREIMNGRARDGLHSLSLKLPKLDRFDPSGTPSEEASRKTAGLLSYVALEAVERALLSGDSVVSAHAQPLVPGSILDEVAKIPGVNITKATVDRTYLELVGVDHGRVREFCHVLEEKFGIAVLPETVPKMTIGQLKRLKREPLDVQKDIPGFEAYVSTVDDDEIRATSTVVLMATLVHRSKLRNDELNLNQDTLCIIPGLEGHHKRFEALCERLKIPALVFQLGHDHLEDSLQEAAQRLADSIMKYVAPKQTFYLLGYEFGVLLCLEVAAILERNGMTGTVYLLGGTPEDIRSSIDARWRETDEETMQNALVQHIYFIICQSTSTKLEELLSKCRNWPEKLEVLVKVAQEKVSHSSQYIKGIAGGIYTRIKLLQAYDVQSCKLQSKVILLQSRQFSATSQSLIPLTCQEPVVNDLKASLALALQDHACPNIINSYLHRNVLEAYDASNQCNTYLMNDDDNITNSPFVGDEL